MSGKPALSGYAIKWDNVRREWVARSQPDGLYVLRGHDQAELDAERRCLIERLTGELQTTQEDPEGTPPAPESEGAAEEYQPPPAPRRPPEP